MLKTQLIGYYSKEDNEELFRQAYWLKDTKHILIVTSIRLLIHDEKMNFQKQIEFEEWKVEIFQLHLFSTSYRPEQGFLISFQCSQEPKRELYQSEYLSPFMNMAFCATWFMRARLNEKLELKDKPGEESIWMWYELI